VNDAFDITGTLSTSNVVVIDASQKGTLVELKVDDLKEKTGANGIKVNNHLLALNNTINIGDAGSSEFNNIYGVNVYCDNLKTTGTKIYVYDDLEPEPLSTISLGTAVNPFKIYSSAIYADNIHEVTTSNGIIFNNHILPSANNTLDIGTDLKRVNDTYSTNIRTNQLYGLDGAITANQNINPVSDDGYSLGNDATNRWSKVWCRGLCVDQLLPNTSLITIYGDLEANGTRKIGASTSFSEMYSTTVFANVLSAQGSSDITTNDIIHPTTNDTLSVGKSGYVFNGVHCTGLVCNNIYSISGDVILHNDIRPVDGTKTLGTGSNPWANSTITTLANTTLNTTTVNATGTVDAEDITTNSLDDSGSAGITLKSDLLPSVDDTVSIGNSSYATKNIYVKSGLNVYSSTASGYLAVNPRPSIIIGHKLGMSFYNSLNFNNGVEGKIRYMNSNDVDTTAYFLSSCQVYLPSGYKQVTISYLYKKNTNHGKFDVNYYALKEGEATDNPTLLNAHTVDSYNASILYNVAGLFTISGLDDDSIYHILLQVIGTGKNASSTAYYKLINEDIVLEITE